MLLVGSGAKETALDSRAATILSFLHIVQDGLPRFTPVDNFEFIDQVVDMAVFLDKYECNAAMNIFLNFIKVLEPVPPLMLFLVGVRLRRPDICGEACDLPPQSWGSLTKESTRRTTRRSRNLDHWKVPNFGKDQRTTGWNSTTPQSLDIDMLLPQAIPCTMYLSFPPEYAWALAMGVTMPKSRGSQCCGAIFRGLLETARGAGLEARRMADDGLRYRTMFCVVLLAFTVAHAAVQNVQ